jgi:hypothetical protein
MNRRVLAVVAILFLICSQSLWGQELGFKNLERLIGKWVGQEEIRQSPDSEWEKGTSEWEVRWMPGGFVAESSGSMRVGELEASWIQVWGYHPGLDTVVSWYSDSQGALGAVTSSGWDGRVFSTNWSDHAPGGEVIVGRCTWDHAADFNSAVGSCEQFTNGKWWTYRNVKGKKN